MPKRILIAIIFLSLLVGSGASTYAFLKQSSQSNQTDSPSQRTETTDATNQTDNEACTMFKKETIAAALGGTYADGVEGAASPYAQSTVDPAGSEQKLKNWACDFNQEHDGTDEGAAAALHFSVSVYNFSNVDSAKKYLDIPNAWIAAGDLKHADGSLIDMSGIGDEAYFPDFGEAKQFYKGMEMLYVQTGKKVIILGAASDNPINRSAVRSGLIELAKKI